MRFRSARKGCRSTRSFWRKEDSAICEPITIAIAAGALAGGIIKANAESRAADATAVELERNAYYADQAAGDAVRRGQLAEGKTRLEGGKVIAKQTAALATSNVDITSGSAVDILSDTAGMAELDAQIVKNNAAREAWGYKVQGKQFRGQAAAARAAGQGRALGAFLGGATQAAAYGAAPFMSVAGQGEPNWPAGPPPAGP